MEKKLRCALKLLHRGIKSNKKYQSFSNKTPITFSETPSEVHLSKSIRLKNFLCIVLGKR